MNPAGNAVRPRDLALVAMVCALALTARSALTGCSEVSNNPHPLGSEQTNTMAVPFRARSPKDLDPASSSSNDETPFTYQVYEPLYGYHYLKRPYELVGRAAEEVAHPVYLDRDAHSPPGHLPLRRADLREHLWHEALASESWID
jgi:hypothetical protein